MVVPKLVIRPENGKFVCPLHVEVFEKALQCGALELGR